MTKRALLLAVLLAAGCGERDNDDIKKWMADASKDMRGRVEKIDEPKKFTPFKYESDKAVDPFSPAKVSVLAEEAKKAPKAGGGPRPDLSRPKEVLESYPLENLRMVGAMQQKGAAYAIIKADTSLHRVKVGNYMGQNFGKIVKITETEVMLQEMIEDGSGEYVLRDSTLVLQEEKK
ncbi:MAG: pilus assembly protein PilP [Burkholderiales bacterium]|nr:pilus assembly protein PilP [Burkholderiales bacterium]